jgi:two-component system, chemotaxis family, response regulator Rcp1
MTAKCVSIEILLVEDNPGDVILTREALREGKIANNLHVVEDGEQAMAFLRREGPYAEVPRPDVVLLDLNLPRKDGREVLAEVKSDPKLKHIPVVILTTSRNEEDVMNTYGLHANCYLVKPVEYAPFLEVIRSFESFWLKVVRLPANHQK